MTDVSIDTYLSTSSVRNISFSVEVSSRIWEHRRSLLYFLRSRLVTVMGWRLGLRMLTEAPISSWSAIVQGIT